MLVLGRYVGQSIIVGEDINIKVLENIRFNHINLRISNEKETNNIKLNYGQSIIINNNIIISFLGKTQFNGIKLGIEAPKTINIIREELNKRKFIKCINITNKENWLVEEFNKELAKTLNLSLYTQSN